MRCLFASLLLAPLLAGCQDEPECELLLTARVNPDVATVVDLSWSTETSAASWVEYGTVVDAPTFRVEAGSSTGHEAHLLGLPPLTTVYFRAFSEVDGEELSCAGEVTTNNVPSTIPAIDAEVVDASLVSDAPYVLGTQMNNRVCNLFLMDREGTVLWYEEGPDAEVFMASYLARDGSRVLHNVFDANFSEDIAEIRSVYLDGSEGTPVRTPMGHHAFQELPDGTIAYTYMDVRDWYDPDEGKEVPVVGDAVYTIAPGGEPEELFTTWDWAEPTKGRHWDQGFYPYGADWTHADAVNWREASNTYLLSLANLATVLELDATTGEILRQFGGDGGYTFADGTVPFARPHEARWTDDTHLLLVSTWNDEDTFVSEYEVDDDTRTLRETWTWGRDQHFFVLAQGQAERLENGNTTFNMGTAGTIWEITPDGDVAWQATTSVGYWFGLVHLLDALPGVTPL